MERALVSCIMPTFNAARHLGAALDSVLGQSYRPIEVIVADDGSLDDTVAIAAARGDPVRVERQTTAGPAATRNLGLRASRGELIAFLDPDDLWHPRKLEIQASRLREEPQLDCSVTHVQMFWDEGCDEEEQRYRDHPRMRSVPGYATTTLLARSSAFARVGPLNAKLWYSDATEWFVRAREAGVKVELLPHTLTFHRLHRDNLTRRSDSASRDEFLDLLKAFLDRRRAAGSDA